MWKKEHLESYREKLVNIINELEGNTCSCNVSNKFWCPVHLLCYELKTQLNQLIKDLTSDKYNTSYSQ